MPNSSLEKLVLDQIMDLYDAEKQLIRALPKMAKAASDDELAEGFETHTDQTRGHAERIEQMFEILGARARSKPCEAMKGLIAEGQKMATEYKGAIRDAALVAAARRVEHYEMAAYEALGLAARAAGQPDVMELIQETFKEEAQTDKQLAAVGKRIVKQAAQPDGEETASARDRGAFVSATGRGRTSSSSRGNRRESAHAGSSAGPGSSSRRGGRSSGGHSSQTTIDHEEIRRWTEDRGGKPACVRGTGGRNDIGMLRLEFPGKPGARDEKLQPISWDDFFEKFDERGLALVYQEETARGQKSNFNKLVSRETAGAGKKHASAAY